MRVEATISEPLYAQLVEVAERLHVTKSAILDEALALFLTGLTEARHGRRVAIIDPRAPADRAVVSQVATPLLSQAEWVSHRANITLSRNAAEKVDELLAHPPQPTPALRKAVARRKGVRAVR